MSDKERLEYIEEQVQELLTLADSEGCGEANLLAIYNDMIWLIEQAEKVERYEKALKTIAEHQYYGSIGAIGYYAEFKSIAKQALGESE